MYQNYRTEKLFRLYFTELSKTAQPQRKLQHFQKFREYFFSVQLI